MFVFEHALRFDLEPSPDQHFNDITVHDEILIEQMLILCLSCTMFSNSLLLTY